MKCFIILLAVPFFLLPAALAQEAAADQSPADKLGWQLAIHVYTFRKFSLNEGIQKTSSLGLKYLSLSGSVNWNGKSPRVHTLSDQDLKSVHKLLKDAGIVKLVNVGIVPLPGDEAQSRQVFEFAKRAGTDVLVAEPEEAALDTVEKLAKEYNIKVAIHNHPKPSHYWNPDTVLKAVQGRSPLLGACADTGHWIRSGLDPVESIKKLEGRVICLHFKDLNEKKEGSRQHDVPWGTGVGKSKAIMAELKRQGFRGAFCVEYEYNWDNSVPEIAECVKFFNATCAELVRP